ncbi:putative transcription factor C2H2 family [Helianthus annuus]|nr:putative transcription factor C2H2 family [Helianthus annuus]
MDFMPESPAKNHDQAHQIITGKRTDHPSPGSPVTTTYSNSYKAISSDEEEEEDMANCLIMLAHSVSPLNDDKSDDFCCRKTEKLKIRSVTEMTASGGNIHTSCYECKTCNRVFQSFQALGGHRASHKKPKLAMENKPEYSKEYQPKLMVVYEENKIVMNKITSPVTADSCSIQTGHKNNSQTKVHQCSICGSEFLSGQALGGHMRRHRAPLPPSISPTTPPEVGLMNDASDHHVIEKSPVLSLDLNLPPPEVVEDAAGHSSFQFAAGSLQQPLVFSAPALVDCHY